MAKYLCVENNGVAPVESFTLFGLSTARGKDGKIGQFGSGSKHGVSTCLRHGINPIIMSGLNTKIVFDSITGKMKDANSNEEKKYEQVVAHINGELQKLSVVTEFGSIDWTNLTMALREFYSNAMDQGGFNAFVTDEVKAEAGKTRVFLEMTRELDAAYGEMPKTFLSLSGNADAKVIYKDEPSFLKLYRKGVLVYESKDIKSLNDYNLPDITLDESRNLSEYLVPHYVRNGMLSEEKSVARFIDAVIKGIDCAEVTKASTGQNSIHQRMIKKVWGEKYGDATICLPDMLRFVKNKKTNVIPIPSRWFEAFEQCDIEVEKVGGGKTAAKKGYRVMEPDKHVLSLATRIWKKLEKVGMTKDKSMPKINSFVSPMDCGTVTNGYYEDGEIYLNSNGISVKVIIEEFAHYITGGYDETRDFQDYAFYLAALLMFNK